jgi:hypothetical protein
MSAEDDDEVLLEGPPPVARPRPPQVPALQLPVRSEAANTATPTTGTADAIAADADMQHVETAASTSRESAELLPSGAVLTEIDRPSTPHAQLQ